MSNFPPSLKPKLLRKLEAGPSCASNTLPNQSIFDQPEVKKKVDEWFSKLSNIEKINQLFCFTIASDSLQYAKSHMIGSFLVDGNYTAYSRPGNFLLTVEDWAKHMSDEVLPVVQEKYGIPTLFGIDSVHGCNHVVGKVIFPHNINVGKVHSNLKKLDFSPEQTRAIFEECSRKLGYYTALESQKIGFNWIFSPCVALANNLHWGRTYESPSLDHEVVKHYSKSYVQGCQQIIQKQNSSEHFISGTLCSVKHYLGDGATMHGEDQGTSPLPQEPVTGKKTGNEPKTTPEEEAEKLKESVREFFQNNEAGYVGGIEADAGNVMVSYSKISFHYDQYSRKQVVPMHINKPFIDRLFAPKSKIHSSSTFPSPELSDASQTGEGLGFKGFTVSDYDAANRISTFYTQNPSYEPEHGKYNLQDYRQVLLRAIMSGVDQLMMSPATFSENYDSKTNTFKLVQLIQDNIPQEVIDTAVRRILTVKAVMPSSENKTLSLLKETVESIDSQLSNVAGNSNGEHLVAKVVEDFEGLKEQVELSYLLSLLSCTVQSQNGVLFPESVDFPILNPSFLSQSDSKSHLLLLGREAQSNPTIPGKPLWNAFYDDMGIQCGGWTLSWQGIAGYFTPQSDEFKQYEANVNHYWRYLLHKKLKISFPLPSAPTRTPQVSPASQQSPDVLASDLGDFYLVDSVSPRSGVSAQGSQPKVEEHEITYASTILSSLTRSGSKPVIVNLQTSIGHLAQLQSHYNQGNSQALIVVGEFPYAEMLGDIHTHSAIWWEDHSALNPWTPEKQTQTTLSVQLRLQEHPTNETSSVGSPKVGRATPPPKEHFQLEAAVGSKLSIASFKSLYFAHSQKIETVAVVISGRELNISVPLLSPHSLQLIKDHPHLQREFCHPFGEDKLDEILHFGKLTFKEVCKSVVWAGLPGTSGGDAIIDFLTAA